MSPYYRILSPILSVLLACAIAAPALAQETASAGVPDPMGAESLMRLLGGLVVVVLLVFAAAWALRRLGHLPGAGSNGLKVVAAVALGQKERAIVLQVGEEQLLLGVAPGRVETLHRLAQPLPVAAPGARASFAQQLERLRRSEKSS